MKEEEAYWAEEEVPVFDSKPNSTWEYLRTQHLFVDVKLLCERKEMLIGKATISLFTIKQSV